MLKKHDSAIIYIFYNVFKIKARQVIAIKK